MKELKEFLATWMGLGRNWERSVKKLGMEKNLNIFF